MKIQENISLASLTTFKVGGRARYFVQVMTKKDVEEVAKFAREKSLPIFVLGEGSDILVADKDFECVVVQCGNKDVHFDGEIVTAGGGRNWDELVAMCVAKNLQGIECLSGIPGNTGAAPVQNIGAYGQELKDVFVKAVVYDIHEKSFIFLDNKTCEFGYRESIFKNKEFRGRYIIFEVILRLKENGKANINYESLKDYFEEKKIGEVNLESIRRAVLDIRSVKLEDPKKLPNAGSFFKNPILNNEDFDRLKDKYPDARSFLSGDKIKVFAGWLIEQCGWKGKRLGNVGVSKQNALVLVNYDNGSAREVKNLADKIVRDVEKKFGLTLEREVQLVNF